MMADIRCPMCGKTNPDQLDQCQFCEARLKPLISPSASDDIFNFQDDAEEESLPDWFDGGLDDFDDSEDDTPFDGGMDDFLSRIGEDADSDDIPEVQIDQSRAATRMDFDGNGVPDWLEDLETERTTPAFDDVLSDDTFDTETPSWMTADQDDTDPLSDSEGLADWLASEDDQPPVATGDEEEPPAWLTQFGSQDTIPVEDADLEDDDLPAWLAGEDVVANEPPGAETEAAEPIDEGELPEWLTAMEAPEKAEAAPTTEAEEVDLPDWLASEDSVATEPMAAETEAAEPTEEDELPAWLTAVEAPEEVEAVPTIEPEAADLPDWLSGAGEAEPTGTETEATEPINEGDLPEWLTAMEAPEEAEAAPTIEAEAADLPDWLASEVEIEPEPKAAETEAAEPIDEGELPEWLAAMEEPVETEAASAIEAEAADLPDWLASEGEVEAEPMVAETEAAESIDEGELPEWLATMEEPVEAETTSEIEAEEADLPDWLSGEDDVEPEPKAAETEAAEPLDEGELPEWLAAVEEPVETEAAPAIEAEEADLPDWLASEDAVEAEPMTAETEAVERINTDELPEWISSIEEEIAPSDEPEVTISADVDDVPEWLADLDDSTPPEGALPAFDADDEELLGWLGGEESDGETAEPIADAELPTWLTELEGADQIDELAVEPEITEDGDLPDWLVGAGGVAAAAAFLDQDEDDGTPAADAVVNESRAVPDWLQDLEDDQQVGGGEEIATSPFSSEDEIDDDPLSLDSLPDWDTETQITDHGQPSGDQLQLDDADLAPAELPGWLAAMRPVESAPEASIDRGQVETLGPLAGMYSVLSAVPDILRLKKPPVYSSKIQITDAQQTHAALLQALLEVEKQPKKLPRSRPVSSHRVFKSILGAILILMALLAVLVSGEMTPLPGPSMIPDSVRDASKIVEILSPADTVLLAFDYEPGLAGEIDASAAAVVDHMMLKGAKLALISTSPSGPLLAERFIKDVQPTHNYVNGTQYVNLGFIPGGVSGLASFASYPQWVVPNTLDGVPAWGTEPLQNVSQLSDFALIVVMADNPNTAQTWIEQVQPRMNDRPMIAVVSAQVEPMIRPYYDRQDAQLSGLISGLLGGVSYEVLSRDNLATTYWDAFNIVLIVAVSAVFIGSAITLISDLIARRKEAGGESA
jgi:hypothetical protein